METEDIASNQPENVLTTNTLETDIINFTTSLPYWGQYLSEKLLSGHLVDEEELQAAYKYLLEDAELLEKSARPTINIACLSNVGIYKDDLKLCNISCVEGINALVEDQDLKVNPNLTIIYGKNGSGKSGYIRLLNNVFITKGDKTIHPNIHEPISKGKKAVFEFSSNGGRYNLQFPDDCGKPEFKQFSVFDEKSVHAHLNLKNQFEFRPAGLSFFADLIDAYKKLEDMLLADIEKRSQVIKLTDLFEGESEIKTVISTVSVRTKMEHLEKYVPFTTAEKDLRTTYEAEKAKLVSLVKDKEIQELNEKKTLIATLRASLLSFNRYFSEEQLTKANEKIIDSNAKEEIAKNFNIERFKAGGHNGIGGKAWRGFISAADTFARLQDRPNNAYPTDADNCLLCQQPLNETASALISSYWSFIKSKAEQDSKEAILKLEQATNVLNKLDFNVLPASGILYKWLSENKEEELQYILEVITSQNKLRDELTNAISGKNIIDTVSVQTDVEILDKLIEGIDATILALQNTEMAIAIEEVQFKIVYLNHKEKLNDHLTTISKVITDINWTAKATKAKGSIAKKSLTNKEKELSALYFNQAYVDRFNDECKNLNGVFDISINHTGSAGTSYRQLTLKGKQPSDVLSEGEQKVISLADFLSETILSGVNRGLIFDDPVNSLDERRKSRIAERLIEESINRQVVIFTHDLVFVSLLISDCKDKSKQFDCHWIEQRDGKPGYISLNNSPSYEKEYRSFEIPNKFYQKARKPEANAKEREYNIQQGFTALRTCYEVLVINDLFVNVVQRFNERVSVDSLKDVFFNDDLKKEISAGFYHCCKYMEGHTHSDGFAYQAPELDNLKEELERYTEIKNNIKKYKAERKAAYTSSGSVS